MKKFLITLFCLMMFSVAQADTLKIIVTYNPGGIADAFARIIEKEMNNRGRNTIVINKGSAEGIVAINEMLTAKPDGNTILFSGTGPIILKSVEDEKNYNNMTKLVPVLRLADSPSVIVANPKLNVKNLKDVIKLSKTKSLNIGTASAATRGISNVIFTKETNSVYIPFMGDTGVVNNILNNSLDIGMGGAIGSYTGFIDSGKFTPIAVSSDTPFVTKGGVKIKTIKEQGINFSSVIFFGIFLPPGASDDTRNKLFYTFKTILDMPETRDAIHARAMTPANQEAPEDFAKFLDADYKKWRKLLHD